MQYDVRVYAKHDIIAEDGGICRFGAVCPPTADPKSARLWNELGIAFDQTVPVPLMEHGKQYRITIEEIAE